MGLDLRNVLLEGGGEQVSSTNPCYHVKGISQWLVDNCSVPTRLFKMDRTRNGSTYKQYPTYKNE